MSPSEGKEESGGLKQKLPVILIAVQFLLVGLIGYDWFNERNTVKPPPPDPPPPGAKPPLSTESPNYVAVVSRLGETGLAAEYGPDLVGLNMFDGGRAGSALEREQEVNNLLAEARRKISSQAYEEARAVAEQAREKMPWYPSTLSLLEEIKRLLEPAAPAAGRGRPGGAPGR